VLCPVEPRISRGRNALAGGRRFTAAGVGSRFEPDGKKRWRVVFRHRLHRRPTTSAGLIPSRRPHGHRLRPRTAAGLCPAGAGLSERPRASGWRGKQNIRPGLRAPDVTAAVWPVSDRLRCEPSSVSIRTPATDVDHHARSDRLPAPVFAIPRSDIPIRRLVGRGQELEIRQGLGGQRTGMEPYPRSRRSNGLFPNYFCLNGPDISAPGGANVAECAWALMQRTEKSTRIESVRPQQPAGVQRSAPHLRAPRSRNCLARFSYMAFACHPARPRTFQNYTEGAGPH